MATVNDYTRTTWQTGDVIDATKMNNIETQLDAVTDNARDNGTAPVFSTTKTYAVGEHVLYNGEVYRCKTAVTNAGAWVANNWVKAYLSSDMEGEVSELKSAIEDCDNRISIADDAIFVSTKKNTSNWPTNSAYIYENGTVTIEEVSGWRRSPEISVNEGEIYRYYASQGKTHRIRVWVVTDDSLNVLAVAPDRYTDSHEQFYYTFKIPTGGTKLLLTFDNHSSNPNPRFGLWTITERLENAPTDRGLLSDLGITTLLDCTKYGFYRSGTAYTANISDLPINYNGMAFQLYCDTPAYASNAFCKQTLQAIDGSSWFRVINNTTSGWAVYQDWIKLPGPSDIPVNPLQGKKLSLLGDSISALAGTIPEGNAAYYSGSNHGITSASQMWWSVLCSETGMIPCVINGWSGSGINWQTDANHADIVPMSDDSRCNGLHNGDDVPDVILIAGGVNDYSYAESAQNEPLEWDGKSVPGYTEPTAGKRVYDSFTEAYAAMIKKLQTNYPNAIIVALSTWFTMRGTDNGYTLTHAVGGNTYTQQDYNDKIRYVAEQMHIPYIDVSNIGFNRNNFYPIYANDSATIPTHPKASGHKVMGLAIAEKIKSLIYGFES